MSETPLHLAVIEDRLEEVQRCADNQQWLFTPNSLGFTPLEIAEFLGKEEAIRILNPNRTPHTIQVVHPDETHISSYTEADFPLAAEIDYYPYLRFASYQSLKETIHNCPWLLKSTFLGKENREWGALYRPQLRQGAIAESVIKWINPRIGYGLFATKPISADQYIGEYTGLVRPMSRLNPNPNGYCFHYPTRFWSWKYLMIDALHGGNELRFSNHSHDNPSMKPHCLVDRGLLHLAFFATSDIAAGEELTFDYGKDYWKKRGKQGIVPL